MSYLEPASSNCTQAERDSRLQNLCLNVIATDHRIKQSWHNIDVILVKHYFSADEAGHYAALSQLGKIIIFGTGAIASVMFPLVVERFEKHEMYSIR